jgi:DNA helicase-2/ATP-dependent DNA helicase PcrA
VTGKGGSLTGRVWGGTFHASANRLLRIYAKAARLDRDFTVMDRSDAEDMINVIRHDVGLDDRGRRFPRKETCLAIYSRCVSGSEELGDVLSRHFPWCAEWQDDLKPLFRAYVEQKQERNVLDYDDLLLYWAHLLSDEKVAPEMAGRFDHVLVDEYQDTNMIQSEILRGMRGHNDNITVVGDDAQSIYSFRSATVRNMLDFPKQFPGARVLTLQQNYRSVMPILRATNRVIARAKERYTKDLWSARKEGARPKLVTCRDEHHQDEYVIERVLEHYEQGIPLKEQGVLFRAAHFSDSLEIELTRRNIPYHKYGGLRFLESSHVKDVIAFLRIAENPRDQMAWFRSLQLLDGVGATIANRAIQHVSDHGNQALSLESFDAPPSARESVKTLASMLRDISGEPEPPPAGQVERIRGFYDPILQKVYDNPTVRGRDLVNLEKIATDYRSRGKFLVDLQLDPPVSTSDLAGPPTKDEDWLVLSTIHSAKGCEWDVVYLIHAADGCLPSDMSTGSEEEIEEERRLTYVAMTRPRDFLYVTWPFRYYHKRQKYGDNHSFAQPSRFLTEDVRALFDEVNKGDAQTEDGPSGTSSRRDVQARMLAMWD